LLLEVATKDWPFEIVAVADSNMLAERAHLLGLSISMEPANYATAPSPHRAGLLPVDHVTCMYSVVAGKLTSGNAAYVLTTLDRAIDHCLIGRANALVTGPIHKATITQSGEPFDGHTNYLATRCQAPPPIMLLTTADQSFRVALATMHLPLVDVPTALSVEGLQHVFRTTADGLQRDFGLLSPRLLVTGLNPHAGEDGTLGTEETHVIKPAILAARNHGIHIEGPFSADTVFVDDLRTRGDVVIAMYHDQGLPAIKYAGFGRVINVTLGLPIVRTSVDHGTAADLAGTGRAQAKSLRAAVETAADIVRSRGT